MMNRPTGSNQGQLNGRLTLNVYQLAEVTGRNGSDKQFCQGLVKGTGRAGYARYLVCSGQGFREKIPLLKNQRDDKR